LILAYGNGEYMVACEVREVAYLGTIGVKRRLFVVQFYGLGIEIDGSGPVLSFESFIALVFERCGLLLRVPHGCLEQAAGETVKERPVVGETGRRDGQTQRT
jgi:hypothetical protein